MKKWTNRGNMFSLMRLRNRKGFTLIETALSLVLATIVLYGLVMLVIEMKEIMWIDMQVRNAEEWGLAYVNTFTKCMRNGFNPEITTSGWPSRAKVNFIDPQETIQKNRLYEFRRDSRTKMPSIYVDGQKNDDMLFLQSYDRRDAFEVDPRNFLISYNDYDANFTSSRFDSSFITLEFTISYTRDKSGVFGNFYSKEIEFQGSAYVINWNWPSSGSEDVGID